MEETNTTIISCQIFSRSDDGEDWPTKMWRWALKVRKGEKTSVEQVFWFVHNCYAF